MVGVISYIVAFIATKIEPFKLALKYNISQPCIRKIFKNVGLKRFLLYDPIMKDLIIIPPHVCISKGLFTHLKQHIVTSFQIENGLYCLNKVNSNRQLRGYPRFISFCSRYMFKLLDDFIFVYQ